MALTWTVNFKWDGVNNTNEVTRVLHGRVTRGRKTLLQPGSNGFTPQEIGECVLTLKNADGRFDPLNSSSAIYPYVAPGVQVTLSVSDGTSYGVFKGHVFNIQPIRGSGGVNTKRVQITVKDGWQWLQDRKVRYAGTANAGTRGAIEALATAADYPFSTAVTTGVDTIPYWWSSNRSAKDEIQSLADSEFGLVWIATDGTLTYQPRPYRWSIASTQTWTGAQTTDVDFAQPWEVIRNVVQVKVYPTELITYTDGRNPYLWRNQKAFKLRPTKSLTLNIDYTYQGQKTSAYGVLAPVATTDYRGNANANGAGDDLTSQLTVALTDKGEAAQLIVTNNSATRVVYVVLLQVRGTLINQLDALVVEKDTSGGTNRRTFLLDVPWQQDVEKGQLYAEYLARFLDDARAAPTIRTNTQKAGLAKQMADLNTVHTLNLSTEGINKAYRRCGVEHEWDSHQPNLIQSKINFEATDPSTYWTINTSTFNAQTILAY